jgi:hypothetical protein
MSDDEPHRPDPRARVLWMAAAALAFGVVGALPGALVLTAGEGRPAILLGGLAVGVALGAAFGHALWARRSWVLGVTALELRRGAIVQRAAWIPYYRIQQIDVERGPIERMAGLAQLVVRTAAATTDGTIYGLAPADASLIRQRLLDLAGVDDGV